MINFDSLTLKLFCDENKEFFLGAKIQKVQQPSRNELIFHMRSKGESKKFYINFNPNFYHLCFMTPETEQLRGLSIPKTAPMFCMLLRKYIQNSKILRVEVPKNERIFEIYFEYFDELNEKSLLCLAIELMGKHSNVILYNYDTNVIVGCAHNVSSEKSRERELAGLLPYIYPPKQKRKDLTRVSFDSFMLETEGGAVAQNYNYLTNPLVNQFNVFCKDEFDLYTKLKEFLSQKEYAYFIKNDYSEFALFNVEGSFECATVNEMIDKYFSYHQNLICKENLRKKLIGNLNSQMKKLNTLKSKQIEQINKLEKGLAYKNKADILMANLYYIKSGAKSVDLFDFEGNEITIDLDENLSASDNANRYYNLYKKSKSANEHATELLKETQSQILYFDELLYYAKTALNIDELNDIQEELSPQVDNKKEQQQKVESVEYNGFNIFIGKNKVQNDYILSKISAAEDLWFHPLNAAGAHVLVKLNNSKDVVSDDVLLKAAELTKEFSSQKNNSKCSIIYTKRKYVKKANNKLAFVTYKNETEIIV